MQSTVAFLLVLAVACQAQFIHPSPYGLPTVYAGYPVSVGHQYGYPVTVSSQYHAQDELGQARFGYAHPGQAAVNYRDAFGNQIGSYAYFNPEGKEVRVSYTADHRGFRVLSNDLPVAPVADLVAPVQVQDTPEVAQAKATHLAALAAATAPVVAAEPVAEVAAPAAVAETKVENQEVAVAPVETPAAPVAADAPVAEVAPVNVLPVQVQDTAEVAAAKQEFAVLYAAAKAAAAAAPDTAPVSRRKRQVLGYGSPLPYAYSGYYGAPFGYNYASPYGYNYASPYVTNYPVGAGRFGYSFTAPAFVPAPAVAATTTTQTV